MAESEIQVIGLCRWSYPSVATAFRMTPDDLEAAREKLYTPSRLEHRLFLLEHVVLPSIKAQTDQDFLLIFLMGQDLPEPYRGRVLELVADIPQIRTIFAEEGQSQKATCADAINELRVNDVAATAQFRLDDDDAVSVDFVEETRRVFELVQPIYERSGLFGLDFCRGFVMKTTHGDCEFNPVSIRFWTPSMVVFIAPDNPKSLLTFHHLRLWNSMPTLMWMERPMFVRGAHHDNDSAVNNFGRRTRSFRFNMDRLDSFMLRRFMIDVPEVQKIWGDRKAEFMGTVD